MLADICLAFDGSSGWRMMHYTSLLYSAISNEMLTNNVQITFCLTNYPAFIEVQFLQLHKTPKGHCCCCVCVCRIWVGWGKGRCRETAASYHWKDHISTCTTICSYIYCAFCYHSIIIRAAIVVVLAMKKNQLKVYMLLSTVQYN